MKKITFVFVLLLVFSCNGKPDLKFSLSGTTNGLENGTILYLDYNNKSLDSTKVINNVFKFKTKLPNSPIKLWLHNKDFSNYRAFWAENKPMSFDAAKTDFRNANVTGSESENLSFSFYQKINKLPDNEIEEKEIEFVKNNPNSIVSASMLALYSTTWGKDKTKELFEMFSKENKNSKFGKQIIKYIKLNKALKIGDKFVDVESKNQKGELSKLSKFYGKIILLEFWASWCGPCRQENPNLVNTYKKFNSKGFEIFAVSLDIDKESWLKAIKKDNLPWEQVSDLKGEKNEVSLIYGVSEIPDNFLIDENGFIIERNLRGQELNSKLEEILNK
ncbi:TlpA disulfide reductase family protein [uncultured Polaribacter sp.]|uniref:TlpA disulfide reductase family protein n=1 Tax=uncultured Polaribacter sp. TaxID=174711 RepID=UPI002621A7B0|nr:TlpA disulfide reductase family protein [uncultured Polaribacter sp.]